MKVDCVIPSKGSVRENLIHALMKSPNVGRIIIEDTTPLSIARKIGALKCNTEYVAQFDDDVEIDEDWFQTAFSKLSEGVLAVSSMYEEQNPHMKAYLDFFYQHKKPPENIATANVNSLLIKRELFNEYNPPLIFHCEDNYLYNFVTAKGKWVHFMGHAKHWLTFRASNFKSGQNARKYHLITYKQFFKTIFYRFTIPMLILPKTKSLMTLFYFWRWNLQFIAGWIKG